MRCITMHSAKIFVMKYHFFSNEENTFLSLQVDLFLVYKLKILM